MDRENSKKQAAIDEAIILFDRGETGEAMALLKANGIPDEVSQRVLYHPDLRRQYINDYLSGF